MMSNPYILVSIYYIRNLIIATGVSILTSAAWYFSVNKPRKDNYANFYKVRENKLNTRIKIEKFKYSSIFFRFD